jgi:hypothetical protein
MARENFYILLGLNIEPPETDHAIIEDTIRQKQHEWSRLRNHPSKGIQAKQYIGLMPEIRKVMLDKELREQEAIEAQKISRKSKLEKFTGLDRHIEIQLSKGYITDPEIQKLASFHRVSEGTIRERISRKETEKYTEIDKHIELRLGKGYITEEEISRLAKLHGVDPKKIRKRVKGPIKKEVKKVVAGKAIDGAIEKVIRDNLKIVGKTTLYEFLGVPASSDLQTLQKKSKEKEAEVSKIRKKDAAATASGMLVGQCITLFKTEEGRSAYDTTLAQSHLVELNADIDMAGIDGKIRKEYVDLLIARAMELGMDRDEAIAYIENYCRKKGWRFESPKKKRLTRGFAFKIAALILLLLLGGFIAKDTLKKQQLENEYRSVLNKVSQQTSLKEKEKLFQNYLLSHEKNDFTKKAEKKLREIRDQIVNQNYEQARDQADAFLSKNEFDQAQNVYRKFLEDHPKSNLSGTVKKNIAEISKKIEQNEFRTLLSLTDLSTQEKIDGYQQYLKKYPNGPHSKQVSDLLYDLKDGYYAEIKASLVECENQRVWQTCIALIQSFIKNYPNDYRSSELEEIQETFIRNHRNALAINELIKIAREKGSDYKAAKNLYIAYLESNPSPFFRKKIETELQKLEKAEKQAAFHQLLEQKRLLIAESGDRFVTNQDDTITDTRTNLTWSMIGAEYAGTRCMDYESAIAYVKNLTIGGKNDWRLPTEKELIQLYKEAPSFPIGEADWYWTSEFFKSYSDGWVRMVKAVSSKKESPWKSRRMDSRECGGVRAVRP